MTRIDLPPAIASAFTHTRITPTDWRLYGEHAVLVYYEGIANDKLHEAAGFTTHLQGWRVAEYGKIEGKPYIVFKRTDDE